MAGMPHWKTTVAMAAFYAVAAVGLYLAIRDQTALAVVLFVLFALVLLAGNMYVRAKEKAQGTGRRAQGERDEGSGDRPLRPAPRALRLDPEYGRR